MTVWCPACGESVSDIMEAHTVGPVTVSHHHPPREGTAPAGWCVLWPCGCTLSPAMARLLAQV